jgi:hypothetical protein
LSNNKQYIKPFSGLSRRDDLADKPLIYDSLAALVREFQQCYAGYSHKLQKVTIGGPVPTDLTSQVQVQWNKKKFTLNSKCDWNSMSRLPRSFKRDEVSLLSRADQLIFRSRKATTHLASRVAWKHC